MIWADFMSLVLGTGCLRMQIALTTYNRGNKWSPITEKTLFNKIHILTVLTFFFFLENHNHERKLFFIVWCNIPFQHVCIYPLNKMDHRWPFCTWQSLPVPSLLQLYRLHKQLWHQGGPTCRSLRILHSTFVEETNCFKCVSKRTQIFAKNIINLF